MKPGIPWSVKGIDAEAREAAKFAARRSGMTLGEWLNSVILESAEDTDDLERRFGRRRPAQPPVRAASGADDLRARLDQLTAQLAALSLRDQDTAASRYLARSIQDPEADPALKSVLRRLQSQEIGIGEAIAKVHERLDDLSRRLEEHAPAIEDERLAGILGRIGAGEAETARRFDQLDARFDDLDRKFAESSEPRPDPRLDDLMARMEFGEQHTSQAIDRLGEEVGRLGREMAQRPVPVAYERPEDVPGFTALETALRNVVDHIEASDTRTRDTLKTLQERVAATQKLAEGARSATPRDPTQSLERLDRQLAELAQRLEGQERQGEATAKAVVEEKVSRLSEQLTAVRHSTEALVQKAESAAGRIAERQVREAEERLKAMVAEATARAAKAEGNGEVGRMRAEMDALGRKVASLGAEAASRGEVRSLREALEDVAESIAHRPDSAAIAELERRVSELATRSLSEGLDDQLALLGRRIDDLDHALREVGGSAASGEALESLNRHIAAVDQRLTATEQQLGHLATIEQSIAQLFAAVEQTRSSVADVAEATARRVADEMVRRGGASEETTSAIRALEQGLAAVKASAETADQRNQETLEAVHETLEQVIAKLGQLESWHTTTAATLARFEADAREEAPEEPAANEAEEAPEEPAASEAERAVEAPLPAIDWGEGARVEDMPATSWRSLMPDYGAAETPAAEGDRAAGEGFMPALPPLIAPEEEKAAPAFAPVSEPGSAEAPHEALREDYIAAARRAAQSASSRPSVAGLFSRHKPKPASPAAMGGKPAGKPFLSLPFLKGRAKSAKPAGTTGAAAADDTTARRNRLILVGAVLLAAAAAYGLNAQRGATPPASEPRKVGEVAPVEEAAHTEVEAGRQVAAEEHEPVKAAEVKVVDNGLAQRTGMAPQEAIEERASTRSPAPAEETVATASLTPLPQRSETESNAIDNRLAALIVGGKSDRVVADPFVGPRNDEAIAEAVGPAALRAAAIAGDAKAQFVVATRYLEGKVVAQDAAAAARWYQKAAAQGLAAAQYRLGTLFERGLGVPADKVAARMWYERAAEAGNVKAMHNLAVVLADKDSDAADYGRAARWFGAAADHGVKDSQFNLAVLYERGLGVIASRPMAYRWYLIAARQGDGDAEARAKTLRPYLDAAEVKTIEADIAGWKPREAKADANVVAIEEVSWNAAAEEPARTLPPSPELTGSKLISRTQELLAGLGFDIGEADGVMGARTTAAIRRFQSQNGLTIDGMPSNELVRHLMAKAG